MPAPIFLSSLVDLFSGPALGVRGPIISVLYLSHSPCIIVIVYPKTLFESSRPKYSTHFRVFEISDVRDGV